MAGHPEIESATMTGMKPGPRAPMTRIARRISGNANIPSVSLIMGLAIQRGANVLTAPMKMPMEILINWTVKPMNRLILAPYARRCRNDRPISSVPRIACFAPGPKWGSPAGSKTGFNLPSVGM